MGGGDEELPRRELSGVNEIEATRAEVSFVDLVLGHTLRQEVGRDVWIEEHSSVGVDEGIPDMELSPGREEGRAWIRTLDEGRAERDGGRGVGGAVRWCGGCGTSRCEHGAAIVARGAHEDDGRDHEGCHRSGRREDRPPATWSWRRNGQQRELEARPT